jgi:Uncharacterised protein family (UPF0158)
MLMKRAVEYFRALRLDLEARMTPAKLSDLVEALEFQGDEYHVYFDRQTGGIISVAGEILSAVEEGDDESLAGAPGWQKGEVEAAKAIVEDREGRFIDPPDKVEFNEYHQMECFIASLTDSRVASQLSRAIAGRGAFRYFRDTLDRLGFEDHWHRFRDNAMKEFVIEWAEANRVSYTDDVRTIKKRSRA